MPSDDEQVIRGALDEIPIEQVVADAEREGANRWYELCGRLGWDGYTVDDIIAMIDQAKSEEGH